MHCVTYHVLNVSRCAGNRVISVMVGEAQHAPSGTFYRFLKQQEPRRVPAAISRGASIRLWVAADLTCCLTEASWTYPLFVTSVYAARKSRARRREVVNTRLAPRRGGQVAGRFPSFPVTSATNTPPEPSRRNTNFSTKCTSLGLAMGGGHGSVNGESGARNHANRLRRSQSRNDLPTRDRCNSLAPSQIWVSLASRNSRSTLDPLM